ncbi:hypothetical protein [Roseospirillum parvum]|uniref:Uncharacterized protein n=1 Tax=Roseospirillum parvum TaxID=83401 RepID=A0A1G7UF72_9PROT|nr:hypothetical protein [Roseospirillum parvum]SDG45719.1 hypothetical protein SAMN05421742_101300 [Roseospirillum parvum]
MPDLADRLLSLFLSKKARAARARNRAAKKSAAAAHLKGAGQGDSPAREEAIARIRAAQGNISRERAELLLNAMRIRNAKQKILDDLGDEDRARLVTAALRALRDEDR